MLSQPSHSKKMMNEVMRVQSMRQCRRFGYGTQKDAKKSKNDAL